MMDVHLKLKKYQHAVDNHKEQLEQTMTPKHTQNAHKHHSSLRQAEKRENKTPNQTAQAKPQKQRGSQWVVSVSTHPPTIHCRAQYPAERTQ